MAIAYIFLTLSFTRASVAREAAVVAIPASIFCAAIGTAVSVRHPPTEAADWLFRCGVAGGIVGEMWLGVGVYVNGGRTLGEMLGVLARGLVVAAPAGFVAGLALGAEMAVVDSWARRSQAHAQARRVLASAVLVNAIVAAAIWLF